MLFAVEDMVRAWLLMSFCMICSFLIAFFRRPSIILDAYSWYKIMVANLTIRYILVDGVTVRYGVRLPQTDPTTWRLFSSADIRNILRLQRAVEATSSATLSECAEKAETEKSSPTFCENERLADPENEKERQRSVVLFVHGFSSDLTTWHSLIRSLDVCDTVYCVDLPGHGGTERQPTDAEDVSVVGLANFLRRFVVATQLDSVRVHLAGQSLGGAVVGVYASLYPDHVAALTLISPAVEPPFLTEFAARLNERDYSWLLPTTLDGCSVVLQRNLANRRRAEQVPKQLKLAFLDQRLRKLEFYRKVLDSLNTMESRLALLDRAQNIRARTQLIWGREDQITHVSACDTLQRLLGERCVRVDLFERCGHAIFDEAGQALFDCFRQFRDELAADLIPRTVTQSGSLCSIDRIESEAQSQMQPTIRRVLSF